MAKVWNSTLNRNIPLRARSSLRKKGGGNLRFKAVRFNQRTKATSIDKRTRQRVLVRDNGNCIVCGSMYGIELHHYIFASANGLGTPENLACLCQHHHNEIHVNPKTSKDLTEFVKDYLNNLYPNFKDEDRVYKKWTMKKEEIN